MILHINKSRVSISDQHFQIFHLKKFLMLWDTRANFSLRVEHARHDTTIPHWTLMCCMVIGQWLQPQRIPPRTHINTIFSLEPYQNGICYIHTLLIPKSLTNLRVGSSHHPPHPCARPPPAWSWLPAFSWLRTASKQYPLSVHIHHLGVIPSNPHDKTRQNDMAHVTQHLLTLGERVTKIWSSNLHCTDA